MKKVMCAVLFVCLCLGLGGCASWKGCRCGKKACPACSARMTCPKCGMSRDKCKCAAEATCPKCNMPKSQCKCK